jgi:membrane protein implicated in regulation of membrane protease activity
MAVVWLVLAVVLAVAEGLTTTFVLVMFAAGALAAAGGAALGADLWLQVLLFAGVSVAALIGLRPMLRRRLDLQHRGGTAIGMEAIEGTEALVIEDIDENRGQIKIDGEIWNARPFDAQQSFAKGTRVRVIEVKGATALVWRD